MQLTVEQRLNEAGVQYELQNIITIKNLVKMYERQGFNVSESMIVNYIITNYNKDKPNLKQLFSELYKMKLAPIKKTSKVGRNVPCPCGSGIKYKKCCINKN